MNSGRISNILITGSAGFIGSNLAKRIQAESFDIRTGQNGLDFDLVKKAVAGKELVFHMANIPAHRLSVENPYEVMKNNYLITLNFAEACRMHDVKIVFASSFSVYGQQENPFSEDMKMKPDTPYGVTKKACEELLQHYHEMYGTDVIVIRPSNVWGPGDELHEPMQVLPIWVNAVREKKPITVHGENTTRDFTHIDDFVDGMLLASQETGFDVFNVCSGKEIRLLDIANAITDKIKITELPKYETEQWVGDNSKLEKLGWKPKKDFWKELEIYCQNRIGRNFSLKRK